MPVHKFDDEIAQFWISEYTCNSAVNSWHRKGLINTTIELETKYILTIFPYFDDIYGEEFKTIKIQILTEQKENAPTVEVTPGGIRMSGNASIVILNPLNSMIRAATFYVKFNVTFTLDLEPKGNILKAVASGIDLEVENYKPLF